MKQTKIAVAGVTAALLVGAGTGLALNLPSGAGASGRPAATASTDQATASTDGSTAATTPTTGGSGTTDTAVPGAGDDNGHHRGPNGGGMFGRGKFFEDGLAALVKDGTITQAQADAITKAIEALKPTAPQTPTSDGTTPTPTTRVNQFTDVLAALVKDGTITQAESDAITKAIESFRSGDGPGFPGGGFGGGMGGGMGGRGGFGPGTFGGRGLGGGLGAGIDAAAKALGITSDELKADIKNGQTIAQVATAKGVDVQTVIDAVVAAETTKLKDEVTKIVNGVKPTPPTTDATTPTTGG